MSNETYTAEEKQDLLNLARSAIESAINKEFPPDAFGFSDKLMEIRSCFVTLHNPDHSLRGCIGNIRGYEPLAENVIHNAINAAIKDPRFTPVSSTDELLDLEIEISVLTPAKKIGSVDQFVVGKHGIILQRYERSAVFLPQVAPEQGWDKETTLTQLALKAGMKPDVWKQMDTEFFVFEAIVFSEKDFE